LPTQRTGHERRKARPGRRGALVSKLTQHDLEHIAHRLDMPEFADLECNAEALFEGAHDVLVVAVKREVETVENLPLAQA